MEYAGDAVVVRTRVPSYAALLARKIIGKHSTQKGIKMEEADW